jgi:hypothetical protein
MLRLSPKQGVGLEYSPGRTTLNSRRRGGNNLLGIDRSCLFFLSLLSAGEKSRYVPNKPLRGQHLKDQGASSAEQ